LNNASEGESKSTTSPLTVVRGTPPSKGGESYGIIYHYFPLLFKEGCHARRVMTGWLKELIDIMITE